MEAATHASKVKDRVTKKIDLTRKVTEPNHFLAVSNCEDKVGRLEDQVLDSVAKEVEEPLLRLIIRRVEGLKDCIRSACVESSERSKISLFLQDVTVFFEGFNDGTGSEAAGVNVFSAAQDC